VPIADFTAIAEQMKDYVRDRDCIAKWRILMRMRNIISNVVITNPFP